MKTLPLMLAFTLYVIAGCTYTADNKQKESDSIPLNVRITTKTIVHNSASSRLKGACWWCATNL